MNQPGRCRTLLRRLRSSGAIALACAGLLAGCGVQSLEEQLLRRFFDASRAYDRAALEKVAAPGVVFNPVTEGVVDEFGVTVVSDGGDRRTLHVDAVVRAEGTTRRQTLEAVIERTGSGWRLTAITPLPASRTSP